MEGERQRWGSSALVWDLGGRGREIRGGLGVYDGGGRCNLRDSIFEPPFLFQISLFKYASLRVLIVDRGGMLRD